MSSLLKKKLKKVGLNDNESHIYLVLLKNPIQSVASLARLVGIKRTTLYTDLVSLEEKSLITYVVEKKRKLISPAPLISLDSLLTHRELELKKQKDTLDELIPLLEEYVHEKRSHSQVKVFHGSKGVIEAIDQTLTSKEDVYWIGSMKAITQYLDEKQILKLLTWRRIDHGSTAYSLTDAWTYYHSIYGVKEHQKPLRKSKIIADELDYNGAIGVVGNTTILFVADGTPRIYIIEDVMIAKILKHTFMIIWDIL